QTRLATPSFEKISPARQDNSPQARVADSSSRNSVSLSSGCTKKRFPSLGCPSATKIVCPLESIAETQPQLQPALLKLSAMVSQFSFKTLASQSAASPIPSACYWLHSRTDITDNKPHAGDDNGRDS